MSQCSLQTSLESFYDGQARPEVAREIERHLPTCAACAAELERLAQLSDLLGTIRPEPIRADELARLHQAVDGVEDRGVLRLVAGLSAIAASILIISSAWLYDGPRPVNRTIVDRAPQPSWERMAAGGPMPEATGARPSGTAMRDTTNWMIQAMGGEREHGSR